jgi:peptidoglycan hydrolase-like protein with peptidoglycan-binding domain
VTVVDQTVRGPRVGRGIMEIAASILACCLASACVHSRDVAAPPPSALPAVEVDSSGVPFAPAPEGLLRPGAVEMIQSRLRRGGFLQAAEPPGRLGPATREGLRRFQASNDLPATGLPSYRTVEALKLDTDAIFFSAHRPPAANGRKSTDEGSVGARSAPIQQ